MATDLELKEEFVDVFLASGFQETITYTPSGGTAKNISAIVYREGTTQTVSSRRTGAGENKSITRRYDIEIHISTDAIDGIQSVTVMKDKVALKRKVNDTSNENFTVRGIIEEDTGAYWLGLG